MLHQRGLAAIHRRKPDREYDVKLDGDAEARLLKLACSEPPEGHSRWTLHLLADELGMLDEIDFESISHETVRQRLKNALKPHLSSLECDCRSYRNTARTRFRTEFEILNWDTSPNKRGE